MEAPDGVNTEVLALNLHKRGVVIEPGTAFFDDAAPPRNFYRLAYSSISSAKIPQGIAIIADELSKTGLSGTR